MLCVVDLFLVDVHIIIVWFAIRQSAENSSDTAFLPQITPFHSYCTMNLQPIQTKSTSKFSVNSMPKPRRSRLRLLGKGFVKIFKDRHNCFHISLE